MIKNNLVKFVAVILTVSAIFTACKKDEKPAPSKASKLLFNWKITNITIPKVSQPNTDSTIYKACMSDDLVKFTNTGFDFQDGATKCDSTIFNYANSISIQFQKR